MGRTASLRSRVCLFMTSSAVAFDHRYIDRGNLLHDAVLLFQAKAKGQRGSASVTSSDLDSADFPIGQNLGTLAEKLALLFMSNADMRVNITATAAMISELCDIVGTPAYLLVFVQVLREVDIARTWLRTAMQGHPHDLMDSVPMRKEPCYRSEDLRIVRRAMSDGFVEKCNAFYSLLSHLEGMCTEARDEQLFRFLCEVQVLLDLLMSFVN